MDTSICHVQLILLGFDEGIEIGKGKSSICDYDFLFPISCTVLNLALLMFCLVFVSSTLVKLRLSLFLLSTIALLTSCAVEKRHYRNGFYVSWNHNTSRESVASGDTAGLESPAVADQEENGIGNSEEHVPAEKVVTVEEVSGNQTRNDQSTETPSETPARHDQRTDDPKPEGHDRLNPIITPMVGTAFVIPLVLLMLELFGAFPANPYVLLIGLPLVAALLFALAMNLRKKYTVLKSIGDKRESLRTSAHFHRYQILLFIYFAAALMLSLGFALGLTSSGILGWIGVIFTGGGIAVGLGVATVLLVLFVLYWVRWRKDPTGIKPPRNPNPPKDR